MPPGSMMSLRSRNLRSVDLDRLLREIDRGEHGIGHANRLEIDSLAGIRLLLVGGASAGKCGQGKRGSACDDSGKKKAAAKS